MTLQEFVRQVANFDNLSPREKISHFGWYLHAQKDVEVLTNGNVRECFRELYMAPPDMSVYLPRMQGTELLSVRGGYKLEGRLRRAMDDKYGQHPTVIAVTALLADLPQKIPNIDERAFMAEALNCYRVQAYRAAIVMAWNLTFDHVLRWMFDDPARVAAFNAAFATRFPKKAFVVGRVEDFEEIKEADAIEVWRTANTLSKNVTTILRDRLTRRNLAAHPSNIVITQHQADDFIVDVVTNVVLTVK